MNNISSKFTDDLEMWRMALFLNTSGADAINISGLLV